ncbi:MAG: alpha/beta fold hydrolase [Bryobacteraceae bacterium]|jgi:dienelactone hydrolase
MVQPPIQALAVLLLTGAALSAQFEYDTKQPFDTTCDPIATRTDAEVRGCGFTGPRGGRVNFILVKPGSAKPAKAPHPGVIFQHGGGQSMTNYLSEALILARAGVISVIPDAPARGEGKNSEINAMKPESARDSQAEIVITERRVLDWLLQQPGIDSKRIAYVGHSYGAIAGGVLAGIEPRIAAFVLSGGVTSKTLDMLRETDPDRYLPKARAPVLVQCARLDTDDNVRGCPLVYQITGGPKQLNWYDDDHHFTSLEALRDRLAWLEKYLALEALGPYIAEFLKR